jgi:hypothetical protein
MGAPTRALQNFFEFQKQRCNDQRLLAWKQFIHKATLNPFTPNTPYLPHSFIECRHFCSIESARWRATNVVWASETEEQCVRIWPACQCLSVRSPAYGPNSKPVTRKSAKGTPKSIDEPIIGLEKLGFICLTQFADHEEFGEQFPSRCLL